MPQFGRQISGRPGRRRTYRSLLHSLWTLALLTIIVVIVAACAGVNDSGTHEDFVQTQAASQPEEGEHQGEEAGTPGSEASPGAEASPASSGGGELATTGQELVTSLGCTGCHSIDGSAGVGPSWQGLFGHDVPLANGQTVTANEEYIATSIHDPSAQIVEGFQDLMPKTYADLPDDQVDAIIAYIKTLQ